MKNIKVLTATILLGMGLMIGGCGNNNTDINNVPTVQQAQVVTLDSTTIDKPQLRVGDTVRFHNVQPKFQVGTIANGRKILNETYGGEHGVTMYTVDITDIPKGSNAVFIVDSVTTMMDNAQTHKMSGYYTGKDDKVVITHVLGHAKEVK